MPIVDNFEKLQEQHTRGDFYQCRRTFLGKQGEDTLEPPDMFKTRNQMIKIRDLKAKSIRLDAVPNNFLNIIKDDPKTIEKNKKAKDQVKKEKEKKKVSLIFLSKYTSLKPQDWTIELQAGVRVYVNKNSGEVTTVCPWKEATASQTPTPKGVVDQGQRLQSPKQTVEEKKEEEEEEVEEGGEGYIYVYIYMEYYRCLFRETTVQSHEV